MPISNQTPNPGKNAARGADKRRGSRYVISPTFPIKAVLSLIDHDAPKRAAMLSGKPGLKGSGIVWKDWPGTLVDLSSTGANIHVNLAAVAFSDDPCRMKLSLGSYLLEIPCTVAHFLCYSQFANCGVQFNFPDTDTERAYYQVLEPVIIGTSLTPIDPKPDNSGLFKEQYSGKNASLLTVWRQTPGGDLTSFDFRINRYGVRWNLGLTELSTYGVEENRTSVTKAPFRAAPKFKLKAGAKPEGSRPTVLLTEAQDEEIRWVFCLAVSNLSPSVSADVRKFLLSLVVA